MCANDVTVFVIICFQLLRNVYDFLSWICLFFAKDKTCSTNNWPDSKSARLIITWDILTLQGHAKNCAKLSRLKKVFFLSTTNTTFCGSNNYWRYKWNLRYCARDTKVYSSDFANFKIGLEQDRIKKQVFWRNLKFEGKICQKVKILTNKSLLFYKNIAVLFYVDCTFSIQSLLSRFCALWYRAIFF